MKFLKIGSVIGTLGAAAGGATLFFISKDSKNDITKKFNEFGYEILDTSKDEGWNDILVDYKSAPESERFSGNSDDKENLKNQCKKALKDNYELARRWCVKKQTISQILKKKGFKSIDTTKINSDPIWKKKVQELIDTGNNKIKFGGGITGKLDLDLVTVWSTCQTVKIEETKTTSKEFEEELNKAREWCSNK